MEKKAGFHCVSLIESYSIARSFKSGNTVEVKRNEANSLLQCLCEGISIHGDGNVKNDYYNTDYYFISRSRGNGNKDDLLADGIFSCTNQGESKSNRTVECFAPADRL